MAPALILALSLLATAASAPGGAPPGEPLPAGAPTDEYELTGWCFGALGEYLEIYDRVKPDLVDIDRQWGSSVQEAEPYASDIAAARVELKVLAGALEAAEKASPRPIARQGAAAIKLGQGIWTRVENRPRRELARAWLTWGLPDQCGVTARTLAAKASLLGRALTYNASPNEAQPIPPPPEGAPTIQPYAPIAPATPSPAPPTVAQEASSTPAHELPPAPEPAAAAPQARPVDVAAAEVKPTVIQDAPAKPAAAPPPTPTAPRAPPPSSDEPQEPVL